MSSILSLPTKCSFNDRGLEQVTSVKTNPIKLLLGYGELNFIKGRVVVGFGPVHKGDRRFWRKPFLREEMVHSDAAVEGALPQKCDNMAISSSGLGHWVFIPATGVRTPVSSPYGQDIGGTYA